MAICRPSSNTETSAICAPSLAKWRGHFFDSRKLKTVRELLYNCLRASVIQYRLSAQVIGEDDAGNNGHSKQECRNSKELEVVEPSSKKSAVHRRASYRHPRKSG
jgi:hypothetical protein